MKKSQPTTFIFMGKGDIEMPENKAIIRIVKGYDFSELLTTCYSLLTTHYSLLITHYSLLTTHYSLLTTFYSLLTTYYSLLTTHY